mgnify:FL=1
MDKRPKILWSGDAVAKTGFARVTENLVNRLKDKFDIVILANNWWGDACELQKEFKMYPSSNRFQTEPFGVQRIAEIVKAEKPDIVFVNNDIWIVNQLYDQIAKEHEAGDFKFIAYCPMDSYEWTGSLLDRSLKWDKLIIYTEFGAKEFLNAGYDKEVAVIPHGITAGQFYPTDKNECRRRLGLKPDDFIVFNGNRNQARKRIDVTIEAFARFAVNRPDTKLYLHMGLKDQGWDVMSLFGQEMRKRDIDPNGRIIMTAQNPNPPNVSVEMLNIIYGAVDVGVNTCKGEGHGLVNHEHAACRRAQVVPDHTSLSEIFDGACPKIKAQFVDVDLNYNRRMPIPSAEDLSTILGQFYEDRALLDSVADSCYERATDPMYQWDNIAPQFEEIFEEALV